jgi:diguanylate cyclase (GGDEF)-like protein
MNAEYIAENESCLLEEMLSIRDLFCTSDQIGNGLVQQKAMGILRLCPGMTLEAWEILAQQHGLNDWITVPVDKDALPHLRHVQSVLGKLSYETEHDPLTGLSNRRVFERILDQEIERSQRGKTSVSLAILDLDNFKAVNDTYGHLKGDEVLIDLGDLISRNSRRYDLVSRIGGEEFAVIISGVGIFKAEQMLDRLLAQIRELEFSTPDGTGKFGISCSAGVTSYKGLIEIKPHELIDEADKALYEAKNSGKDCVKTSDPVDLQAVTKQTLVHANEKKFLFTGK